LQVRTSEYQEWYLTVDSIPTDVGTSKSPTYPAHNNPKSNAKLQLRCRGLSVQRQVTGIFTGATISPCPSSRQCPSRYAFRAGRNLPDKEFRYLRTVIVTAAVYRGFGSELRPRGLTLPLNLPAPGRRQSLYVVFLTLQRPVFLVNSRLGHFTAASSCFSRASRDRTLLRHPFFQSYGVNLPSS
jgi:hypothetical protein